MGGGWLIPVLNLLDMGGGPVVVETAGTVCGVARLEPAVGGRTACRARVAGTVGCAPAVGGTAKLEEC